MYPLRVYGYASELGLDKVAAKASTHLLHPPLTSYSTEEMKAIPTAEAYHKLALLHEFRTRKIRETLMNEEVFPHGYGECSRHAQRTKDLWKTRKHVVYNQIQAATDAAAEMVSLGEQPVADCQSCSKAWNAAVAMLSYKCARIPRRIDKLPTEVPAG
ncbi:hypothetical protein EW026_g381 [Hermanssonia centrifuga]|uniref:Uncharacterized protein n=1 Tax=Hermanssonia centrifuga TaxID=98765 RepID=A0A4V3XBL8_9APHY|nr:hypothetical protein EW026_g381 [Hermanssonia centrifuga]